MNKSQLISAIAEEVTTPKAEVKQVVDTLFRLAYANLDKGEKLVISGFGVFSVAEVSARVGRNPRTGESVKIAASRNVRFRSSMDIK